ncbi:unnamed protein product, partial [Choristocarpus tenellus]
PRPPPLRFYVTLEGTRETWVRFRCRREHFRQLFEVMNFSPVFHCKNGSLFTGDEGFLLLIRRLGYPEEFDIECSELSCLFNTVVDWVWQTHRHRIKDNESKYPRGYEFCPVFACSGYMIIGFLDGTLQRMCRLGGPMELDLQWEVYDGHHRAHGLGFQSVEFPDGMIGDIFGPMSGRRHNAHILREGRLNYGLGKLGQGFQYQVYRDAAYPVLSHVSRGFRGANLTPARKAYNRELSRVRISVEWGFGKVVQMYPFVEFKKNLKLLLQSVGMYYLVTALLTNAHTCLYGSQIGIYFDMPSPSVEAYFA